MLAPWKKSYDQPKEHIQNQRLYFANEGPLVKAMVFPVVVYGCESWTIKESWALKNWCFWTVVLRVPWTTRRSNLSSLKEISLNIHRKDWCWSWNSNTLATWCKELSHWKRPWCWERFKAEEGGDRGWDDWIALLSRWTWVWARSRSWWWTGKPGVLQSMGLQRVGHDWEIELNWSEGNKLNQVTWEQEVEIRCQGYSAHLCTHRHLWSPVPASLQVTLPPCFYV